MDDELFMSEVSPQPRGQSKFRLQNYVIPLKISELYEDHFQEVLR